MIILSICENVMKSNTVKGYEFIFNGRYKGIKINKIKVRTSIQLTLGKKYYMTLKVYRVEMNHLKTDLVNCKEINK